MQLQRVCGNIDVYQVIIGVHIILFTYKIKIFYFTKASECLNNANLKSN